jgi:hypothetical protein
MKEVTVVLPWHTDEEEIVALECQGIKVELTAAWPDGLADAGKQEALLLAAGAACCYTDIG